MKGMCGGQILGLYVCVCACVCMHICACVCVYSLVWPTVV